MAKKRSKHTPASGGAEPRRSPRGKKKGASPKAKHAVRAEEPAPVLLLAAPKLSRRARLLAATRSLHQRGRTGLTRLSAHSAHVLRRGWESSRPVFTRIGEAFVGLSIIAAVFLTLFLGYSYAISYRMLPNTQVAGIPIGGMKPADALTLLQERVRDFETAGIAYDVEGTVVTLHPIEDLGVSLRPEDALRPILEQNTRGGFWEVQRARFSALFHTTAHSMPMEFDEANVASRLRGRIPELANEPKEPAVSWDGAAFAVTPGSSARSADIADVVEQTRAATLALAPSTVHIALQDLHPHVSDDAAAQAAQRAKELLVTPIQLTYRNGSRGGPWKIDAQRDPSWFTFTPEDDGTMRIGLDDGRLAKLLTEEIASQVNQTHSDASVKHTDPSSWRVEVTGEAKDGHAVLVEDSASALQSALASAAVSSSADAISVELLADYEPGKVLGEQGEDLGLTDLLAHARSNFASSPSGRDFNVRKGMKIYNGLLIPQGAEFSFNSFLGPVDAAHGWKDALTIFQGGLDTRMEAGGGICQVSTTVYQAAVLAGLKVTQRRAHSYFVSYYAKPPGLNGIDATIFPGSQDLVFVNDTPGPILMLSGAEGTIASVQLFGTKDREVALDGPYKSGSYGAGAPILTEDPTLAPGQVVIEKQGHSGHSVTWYQTIKRADGTEEKITIFSGYRAVPSQGRRGPSGDPGAVAVEGSPVAGG